jgi:drug/metabolite transporter (DMT)-like permease
VLAVILALASAIGYGSSDFAAGLASRTASVIRVTLLASLMATAVTLAVLPFAAAERPSGASLAWGAVAGASGTVGGIALYLGFRYAAFSVAGPLSAVGTAGFSVLAGLLWGERPSPLALAGIALALPAIVGVSAGAGDAEADGGTGADEAGGHLSRPAAGVVAGLIAGACFALLLIGLNRAGSRSGLWPVASAEVAELAVAVAAAALTRNLGRPGGRRTRWLAVITGATGAAGTILYFFASHDGLLAVTAVLTSLYPASTILLARLMLGERLTRLRLAGLVLAGGCVALIAVGGTG